MFRSWILALFVSCHFHLALRSSSSELLMDPSCFIPHVNSHSMAVQESWKKPFLLWNARHVKVGSLWRYQYQGMATDAKASSGRWQRLQSISFAKYVRGLKWFPIPLSLGFAYLAFQQFRHVRKRELTKLASITDPSLHIASDLQVCLYCALPLRATSRMWGWLNSLELPKWLRSPLITAFVWTYDCNLEEAAIADPVQYRNLGDFFRRALRPDARIIHQGQCLVSPSDGTVLNFGRVDRGQVEQVKGITYSIKAFLGPNLQPMVTGNQTVVEGVTIPDNQYQQALFMGNGTTDLYHCVIYLAPGDYHRFHSPADWTVLHRRHFPGELLSVRPGITGWIAGLFSLNERVVYTGRWKHGFFAMVAVGATNVGSVRVYFDKELATNRRHFRPGSYHDFSFVSNVNNNDGDKVGVTFHKGDAFGEFNLGSTVVLIFEAPKGMTFSIKPGQKIKYGELLSHLLPHP